MTIAAAPRLSELLDRAEAAGCFAGGSPPDPEGVREAAEVHPLPPALAQVYERANGLLFDTVELFDPADYADVNSDSDLSLELPGVVFIGSDGMDGFFLIDEQRLLGSTDDAVYWSDRTELSPDDARISATDLAELIERALDGEPLNQGQSVGALSLERLLAAIELHADDVVAHPGYGDPEAMLAARDLGLPIPFGLIDFYSRCDGLHLRSMDLDVLSLRQLKPVDGSIEDGHVGAVWFARDKSGWRHAVTCGGWRGLPANRLISLRREEDIATAASLGRFSDVLSTWIESSGPAKGRR